jgi:hypothetical protein
MSIISTTEELKQYVEVAAALKMPTVEPSLRIAERRNLRSCLGEQLFNRLLLSYKDAGSKVDSMPAVLQELTKLSQAVVANIAMALLIPRLSVTISDTGISRTESDSKKSAFQYQEVNLRESYLRAGYDGLDDVLNYLEANKDEFPEWVSSPSYLDYKKYFIQSAEQFSASFNIQHSRLAFLSIRYIMKRVEDFQVQDITGKKLFAVLKNEVKSGSVSDANQVLLDGFIKPGVALITIAKGVWERALDISENGVTVSIKGSTDNNELRQSAEINKQQKMADQLLADGNEYLSRLGQFLNDNITDYPDFQRPEVDTHLFKIKNNPNNGIFSV